MVFRANKNQKQEVQLYHLRPHSDLSVQFIPCEEINLAAFHEMVVNAFKKEYNHISCMIMEGTNQSPPTVTWSAYILENKWYPKFDPLVIFDESLFIQWITKLTQLGWEKGGISIRMDNPCNEVTKIKNKNLFARTMKKMEAHQQGPLTHKRMAEESSGPEYNNLEVYSEQILQKYRMNSGYNQIHPVFLDPTNVDQYILLIMGNVEKCAKDLVSGELLTASHLLL
ncbi:hypothetical protein VP01_4828g1 [Puccinia sorghi]|uniref:Uncharacterized protein n=1 Tax=Puccinia sorghi TaxID=27349 RepID=A0A0L6UMH5_9BASI|nr:hypothetical protein VP01_4828g1 [Puccinia sorghi]